VCTLLAGQPCADAATSVWTVPRPTLPARQPVQRPARRQWHRATARKRSRAPSIPPHPTHPTHPCRSEDGPALHLYRPAAASNTGASSASTLLGPPRREPRSVATMLLSRPGWARCAHKRGGSLPGRRGLGGCIDIVSPRCLPACPLCKIVATFGPYKPR